MNLNQKEKLTYPLFNDQFFEKFIQYLPELTEIAAQRRTNGPVKSKETAGRKK
ncbi:hypothetical protein ACE41H_02620 [Paenibacillus enshidis]|uniref:IS5/IS1182 family transposase n=1 Tax=Paenibacillus enshidis TaxID=1458439 RepID=A0ABV5ANC2_9BACL